jgi:RNA polymerase sigma-70 factor, ECF subfamily
VGRNADLVARTLDGDGEAFAQIMEAYGGRVYKVVRDQMKHDEDVEEIVQEVFCTAYQRLTSLREPLALGAWLARIAANTATQRLRRQQVRARIFDMEPGDVLPTYRQPRTRATDDAVLVMLAAVESLPPAYHRVVNLFHFQGYSCREVGTTLGISRYAVKWRLHEARRRLRAGLEPVLEEIHAWTQV